MTIIGIWTIGDLKEQYRFSAVIILLMISSLFACEAQNIPCEYSLIYDSLTMSNVYEVADMMPTPLEKTISIKEYIITKYIGTRNIGMQFQFGLGFVVTKSGKIIGFRICHKDVNKAFDEYTEEEKQIIAILKSYPTKWKPGVCSGKNVDILTRISLSFVIDENGKLR